MPLQARQLWAFCLTISACGQAGPVPEATGGTTAAQPADPTGGVASQQPTEPADEPRQPPVDPWAGASCPPAKPSDDSPCDRQGFRCRYGDPLEDFVCTAALRWRKRQFVVSAEARTDDDFGIEQPPSESCASNQPSCPTASKQCVVRCCASSGNQAAGCAGCCEQEACQNLPAEDCPLGRCALRRGCNGSVICTPAVALRPACGPPNSDAAPCCEGLVASCNVKSASDGACLAGLGYGGVPVCLACGDGLCELGENDCNCPADCH